MAYPGAHRQGGRGAASAVLVLLLAGLLLALAAGAAEATHGSRLFTSDAQLASHAYAGSGTQADPYRLRMDPVSATSAHGLVLIGTRAHVVLEGIVVSSGGGAYDGIRLENARNVTIADGVMEGDRAGIAIVDSRDVLVQRTTVKTSRVGVLLERSTNVELVDNKLSVNDRDVSLRESPGNRFRQNNLTTATGQTGFFFEDAASYRNVIETTNVVNFLPVHWYVHPCPARVEGASMELKGVTNVAQIMLHGCQGTVLEGARAKDGVGAGILVLGGGNVSVQRANVEGNANAGILFENGADGRVSQSAVRANGVGVHLRSHPRAAVDNATLESNKADGLLAAPGSHEARLVDSRVNANRAAGVVLSQADRSVLSRNVVEANAGAGVHLTITRHAVLEDNDLRGQLQQVRFTNAPWNEMYRNEMELRENDVGLFFDDAGSYATHVQPSNTVNGVAMRWYHNLTGTPDAPVVLSNFTVAVPGATNVAQVMVHNGRHVVLRDVNASLGVAEGFLVHGSTDVTLTNATAWKNGRDGVRAFQSSLVRVHASDARDNRDDGVSFDQSPLATVENARVSGNGARGVLVEASAMPTIRGVAAEKNRGAGLMVARGSGLAPAHVENNVVQGNLGGGILLHDSALGAVRSNNVTDNGPDGIHLQNVAPGGVLVDNDVSNHTRGIHLANTKAQTLRENRVLIQRAQHGFYFSDETSQNNTIPPTNAVNGVPMRWYNEIKASQAEPLVLEGVRVELPGMTNVAQVLLRNVENATLRGAVAANGTHRGILVTGASNVTVEHGEVRNNTQDGLRLHQSKDVAIRFLRAEANGGHGVSLSQSDRVSVEALASVGSGGQGLRAEATGLVLLRSSLAENRDGGLVVTGAHRDGLGVSNATVLANRGVGAIVSSARHVLVEDGLFSGNAAGGLRLESVGAAHVARNVLESNGEFGIQVSGGRGGGLLLDNRATNHTKGVALVNTNGWEAQGTRVLLGNGTFGFHFADELSYANRLPTSNTVNGTALRWYVGQRFSAEAPLALDGVQVEVRGITNVAQVMVSDSAGVVLNGTLAANGTGHGIYLHRSTGVHVNDALARNNTGDGVSVLEGGQHVVARGEIRHNGGNGLHVQRASGVAARESRVEDNGGAGLRYVGRFAQHAAEDNRVLRNARGGIEMEDAVGPLVSGNALADNGPFGVSLVRVTGIARVDDNDLRNHTKGIRLAATEYAEVHRNQLAILPGQTGLHFEDEASYNNAVPPTNHVNGVPVRWYVGLTGTESAPVVLRDLAVNVTGITNVAQVMLFRSSYVTLENVTASHGVARGVELYHSSSIILRDVTARHNQDGVQLKSTQSSQLLGVDVRDNARGVKLVQSGSNVLTGIDATNSQTGVQVADTESRSNRIQGTEAAGAKTASVQDPSANGLRGNNLVADAGLDRRVRIDRPLRLDGGLATYRFETERIVLQRWEMGQGTVLESTDPAPFRPEHTWNVSGHYRVNLTIVTAEGATLRDSMLVSVVPPLSEPLNVHAAAVGDRNLTLAWDAPLHDGASLVTKYRVYRAPEGKPVVYVGETAGDKRVYLDAAGLVNGQRYFYAVTAANADGEGPSSALLTAAPGTVPDAPRGLAARAGSGTVTLTWAPPADDGGRPVLGYRVLRGPTGFDLALFAEAGNVTSWTDKGVGNGIHYSYAVVAYNALGTGKPSANASAVPAPLPPAPVNLRALPSDRAVTLVWDLPVRPGDAPALRYRVYRGDAPDNLTFLGTAETREYRDLAAVSDATYHYAVAAVNGVGEGPQSEAVKTSLQATDALKPIFLARHPAPEGVHGEATEVWAEYLDNTGVVPGTVRMWIDGVEVTTKAEAGARTVRHAPGAPFGVGLHTVRISAADAAGNVAETEWQFRVVGVEAAKPRWQWSNLTLSAKEVRLGESLLVQATVRNVGGAPGTLDASLLADGESAAERVVMLDPGNETVVAFRHKPNATGLQNVSVGDLAPLQLLVLPADAASPGDGVPDGAAPLAPDEEGGGEEEGGFFSKLVPGPSPVMLLAGAGVAAALAGLRRRRGRA